MNLDRIVKLLPLGAVILIGLGVFETSFYYSFFGVDIMSYLSTSEALTLFLNDIQPMLVLIIVALIHLNVSERIIDKFERVVGTNPFENFIRSLKWGYMIFFGCLVGISSLSIYYQWMNLSNWFIYGFVFCAFQFVTFIFIRKEGKELIKNIRYYHIFLTICIFQIIPLMSLKKVRNIERNKGIKVELSMTNGKQIISTQENRFLGKAGANYLFYNPIKKVTTIYKSEDVERIEIKL